MTETETYTVVEIYDDWYAQQMYDSPEGHGWTEVRRYLDGRVEHVEIQVQPSDWYDSMDGQLDLPAGRRERVVHVEWAEPDSLAVALGLLAELLAVHSPIIGDGGAGSMCRNCQLPAPVGEDPRHLPECRYARVEALLAVVGRTWKHVR